MINIGPETHNVLKGKFKFMDLCISWIKKYEIKKVRAFEEKLNIYIK